jgi:hypothetical protein
MIERRRFVLTSLAGVVAEPLAAEAQPAARGIMTRRPSRLLARGRALTSDSARQSAGVT